ncbi:hypothetical protein [Alteromonas sp.]|uniref:hypothetical protein n=1 Tax=Alteromonas sp. TaxID=232 RepID=UPI000C58E227|nr:hypothetical protein [Alteromonas sp.]MAI39211.1 hypothetical protein [Alteromonas sp.]
MMGKDYKAIFAKIKAAEPFKKGAKVTHKDDVGTDQEGTVYEITLEQGVGAKIWLDPYRTCSFEDLVLVEEAVSTYDKLMDTFNKMELSDNTEVTLTYEDRVDVMHYRGDAEETAAQETCTIETLVSAARSGLKFSTDLIDDMRDQDHLEDYCRGDFDFESYCTEMIKENFYEYDSFVDFSTEQYDHKRGCTTVTASLCTTISDLRECEHSVDCLEGWTAEFFTGNGNMTVEI